MVAPPGTAQSKAPLTVAELAQALQAVNAGAVLVRPRRLRRIIKEDRKLPGLGLQVPHGRTYVIARDRLLALTNRAELGIDDRKLPSAVILIAQPDQDDLDRRPRGDGLRTFWRQLFHARVHAILDRLAAEGKLPEAEVRRRVDRSGRAVFAEVREVLQQERYLLAGDDRSVYEEFAAVYLELRCFAPRLLPVYFPTIEDFAVIDAVLAEDVDCDRVLAETRLEGADEPSALVSRPDQLPVPGEAVASVRRQAHDHGAVAPRSPRADKAAAVGNHVRAAIIRQRALDAVGTHADLSRLAGRLQAALGLDAHEAEKWRRGLLALLGPAAQGIWPVEARLLYDLQKVCIDHERPIYAVDMVEWVYSLGRRPIKRLLPGQREVLIVKHLRSASGRLESARVGDEERGQFAGIMREQLARAEDSLRSKFRPLLAEALADVGMSPANLPERVALNKLCEELLDRVVERGYLNMGDLRDAVSRNNLKLPDLAGPAQLIRGDRLIRANRRLPVALDGVYRRGEFYLRWLQRLSSMAFGTVIGRLLVLYVLLPFGISFLALEGAQHLINPVLELLAPEEAGAESATAGEPDGEEEDAGVFEKRKGEKVHLATPVAVLALGCFLFGLMHSKRFRVWTLRALAVIGEGLRRLVIDLPAYLVDLPLFRRVLASWPVVLFARPVLAGLLIGVIGRVAGLDAHAAIAAGGAVFLGGCLFFNSRLANDLEEAGTDWLVRLWQRLTADFLPGLFHFIMAFFKSLVEAIDRSLYTVDEWLRFRGGEGRGTFVWKLVLGTLWFLVTYVVRAYVNLFIEPQTNPIKHFPVVTVSHKILLPFAPTLIGLGAKLLGGILDPTLAKAVAGVHMFMLPGVFGFLAWELVANWRLYRANQPETLRPDVIGHHGETMLRLLKPGFHSGTAPKIYKKLRRAERKQDREASRHQREALHHAEESVRHFVERELVYLLNTSRCWGALRLSTGHIALGCKAMNVELCCPELADANMRIAFEEQAGELMAAMRCSGWLERLPDDSRRTLTAALAGWYKMAGVHRIESGAPVDVDPADITWQHWVETWERDQAGKPIYCGGDHGQAPRHL
jgi:hypothetical protein